MRHLSVFCLLFILAMLQFTLVDAQKLTDEWRVIKKTRTDASGQKYVLEYSYTNDGRIESVKYLTVAGAVNIIISDFAFNREGNTSSYTVNWTREGAKANVTVNYDNEGRITELKKVSDSRETTTYTYRYSNNTIYGSQQITNRSTPAGNKDSRITYYTEQGGYHEGIYDAAAQTRTSVTTLKQNDRQLEPHPENFMGGFKAPDFLGVIAFISEPEITSRKNENGLITLLSYTALNSNRTYEYTYAKIKKSKPVATIPVENTPVTIIITNINCTAGKEIVEKILKSQDGVQSVQVDIKTGKLLLAYSSDGTPYSEIIKLINEAGFNADRSLSQVPDANPCKATPGNVFNIANLKKVYQLREATASPELKQLLTQQRSMIAQNGFKYQVANTEVSENLLKDITGLAEISRSEILRLRDIDKNKPYNPDVAAFLKNYKPPADASLSSFDARNYIKMPEIRKQKCGSCWVYGAVGLVEISYMAQKGYSTLSSIDLSEKQVLGCSAAGTCNGGWHFIALEWMKNTNQKLLPEESLKDNNLIPKKSTLADAGFVDVLCNVADVKKYFVQVADWGIVQKDKDLDKVADEYDIKEAVVKYGAVAVSLYASPVFKSYASGETFEENEIAYKDSATNHVVIIIGWDNKKQAWLIRNSWGQNWGDGGYGWIKYTTNHVGKRAIWSVAKMAPLPSIRISRSENITPVTLTGELLPGIQFPEGSILSSANGRYEFTNRNTGIVFISKQSDGSLGSSIHIDPFKDYSSVYKFYSDIPLIGNTATSPFYLQDDEGNLFTPFGNKPFKKLVLTDGGNLIAYGTDDSILWSLKPVPPKIRRK